MEIIDVNDSKTDELLEYIETLVLLYTRDIDDVDDMRIDFVTAPKSASDDQRFTTLTNVSLDFISRYNENKLTHYFTYREFINNYELKTLIKELGLDKEKFWFLLLFAYDYSESLCINGINVAPSAYEQIKNLTETIESLVKDFDWEHGTTLEKDAKMKLSIKGGKDAIIDNPTAIHFIAGAIKEKLENEQAWKKCYIMNYHAPLDESKEMSDSPYIYYFAKMFLNFFNTIPSIREKRKKGAKHSIREMELVSHLIYFTKLSTNKKLLDIESQTLKAYLKQYKNLDLTLRRSNTYTYFHI